MKIFTNGIHQEIRVTSPDPPPIVDEPKYLPGASIKPRIQITCILVLSHVYADDMNVYDDMQTIMVSDLYDYCEG